MDELAHSVDMDPLEFRLKNAKNERLRNVIRRRGRKVRLEEPQEDRGPRLRHRRGFRKGRLRGGAAPRSASRTAPVKVLRVVEAFECGAVVNPEHLRNQVEGAVAMGIGGALFEQIDFADNQILNPRLSRYRVPRFTDMPVIESVLLDRKDIVSAGAGETPIVGIAPAIGNAIFDATGQRIRSMPLAPKGLENV